MNIVWPTLIGTVFVGGVIPMILWYLRRHDLLASPGQMRDTIALVSDLRRDVGALENWAIDMVYQWNQQQRELRDAGHINMMIPAPPIPKLLTSQHPTTPPPAPIPTTP